MKARTQHGEIEALLPWYANGSLEDAERRRVSDHLEQCAACREELDFIGDVRAVLRVSAAAEQPAPVPRHAGFASLPGNLQAQIINSPRNRPQHLRKRYWMPAMAASFLAAIGLGVALTVAWLDAPRFQTATSNIAAAENHVLIAVRFVPDTALEELNGLLRRHGAVVVRGPDVNDRWLLEFPLADNDDAAMLRASLEKGERIESVDIVATHTETNSAE